jgi:alkylhydroperoxidase family enzyme
VSWLPARAPADDPLDAVFGLCPELHDAWRDFEGLFWTRGLVDPVLLELCRLRLAALARAAHPLARRREEARAAGLDEARIAALADWRASDAFDARERACLAFAEQFAADAEAISDAEAAAVRDALGDAGFVAFVEALALFDGGARFCAALGVAPAPPVPAR